MSQEPIWKPHAPQPGRRAYLIRDANGGTLTVGPQAKFLASTAKDSLYGGSAGGGKSAASVALPLRWIENRNFRALFLRREAKYLDDAIRKSSDLYPKLGARLVRSPKTIWTFPSGSQVWLNHCELESDVANYDSFEFNLIIYEEITHFTERQVTQINARLRTSDPTLPTYSRGTCNPGGEGGEWVFQRYGAWLNPKYPNPAKPGEVRWFLGLPEGGEKEVPPHTPLAMSRQFIPAELGDNPSINREEYEAQLMAITDPVRRAQLLSGDWLIQPAAGLYFKRSWIPEDNWLDAPWTVDVSARVRAWDLGATVDGDWTRGVKQARRKDKAIAVEDVASCRGTPADVESLIVSTAHMDGKAVTIVLPEDPGQAGKYQTAGFAKALAGFRVVFTRPTGEKTTRFGPFSTQAERKNVFIVRGEWNAPWVAELEAFPESKFDDQADATADGFNHLFSVGRLLHGSGTSPQGQASRTLEGW